MRYKLLPDTQVDSYERKLAHAAVFEASRVLKLTTTPAIKFFREATEFDDNFGALEMTFDHAFGCTNGAEIFLRCNLPDTDLMVTAIHECRHCWQNRSPQWKDRSAVSRERDAKIFEALWPRSDAAVEMLAFKNLLRADG